MLEIFILSFIVEMFQPLTVTPGMELGPRELITKVNIKKIDDIFEHINATFDSVKPPAPVPGVKPTIEPTIERPENFVIAFND